VPTVSPSGVNRVLGLEQETARDRPRRRDFWPDTGENPCDKCYKSMDHYRVDDFIEYALSKRGKENLALTFLAVGCIAGIAVIHRL
jgi:hypothetical protein